MNWINLTIYTSFRLILITLVPLCSALAEYRVYQYVVKSREMESLGDAVKTEGRMIISSLDPISYTGLHGGHSNIKVNLLRTWICPGNTGLSKEYCPGPYQTSAKE